MKGKSTKRFLFVAFALVAGALVYLVSRWFVHPEMTQAQLFANYWKEWTAVAVLIAGTWIYAMWVSQAR